MFSPVPIGHLYYHGFLTHFTQLLKEDLKISYSLFSHHHIKLTIVCAAVRVWEPPAAHGKQEIFIHRFQPGPLDTNASKHWLGAALEM